MSRDAKLHVLVCCWSGWSAAGARYAMTGFMLWSAIGRMCSRGHYSLMYICPEHHWMPSLGVRTLECRPSLGLAYRRPHLRSNPHHRGLAHAHPYPGDHATDRVERLSTMVISQDLRTLRVDELASRQHESRHGSRRAVTPSPPPQAKEDPHHILVKVQSFHPSSPSHKRAFRQPAE